MCAELCFVIFLTVVGDWELWMTFLLAVSCASMRDSCWMMKEQMRLTTLWVFIIIITFIFHIHSIKTLEILKLWINVMMWAVVASLLMLLELWSYRLNKEWFLVSYYSVQNETRVVLVNMIECVPAPQIQHILLTLRA